MNELKRPIISLITPGDVTEQNYDQRESELQEIAKAASKAGVGIFQLREKRIPGRLLFILAEKLRRQFIETRTKLIVNDRFDVALAVGADGVHLPSAGLPSNEVRKHSPKGFLIGRSTHSKEEIEQAVAEQIDYVVFGPVFPSPGKENSVGLNELKKICEMFPNIPILGLGGISEDNFGKVLKTGAAGLAAIRFLNEIKGLETIAHYLNGGYEQ
ncbi:thiamine phosphate synthase [Leptolyngbya sp. 7M]|uniref:thiamine phosphate synthase n=1 Tax=Leptolyngbya sp. 7M TaxID=2812896 RepID=UPI001B8D997C|nr:thiamine phosphate synthase [Leptolyngbya sp. 7M]QYO65273.1 thiamine phosphate synthase [Leptolyngbya sp. 7M]